MNDAIRHDADDRQNSGPFRVLIDDQTLTLGDPKWNGSQLLERAGCRPVEEFLLFQLGPHNLMEDIGLEEVVDVRKPGVERFLTFRSDRSFRFVLDGARQDWGAPKISESNLRRLAGVGADFAIWFEPKGSPARELGVGELVDLTGDELEHFHTERRVVVKVFNEDNGLEFDLVATRRELVDSLIAKIYSHFNLQRQPNDRLRCEQGGEDVFQYAQRTLGEYLDAGHCKCLVWLLVSGTGGA